MRTYRTCSAVLKNLTQIDDLTRGDHWHLETTDSCFYFAEYTAHEGPSYSPCNNLITNFKHKTRFRSNAAVWGYKQSAITQVARAIASVTPPSALATMTFVPVPPSKAKTDPEYDSRCRDALDRISQFAGQTIDVRELVIQERTTRASHTNDVRLQPDELAELYQVDQTLIAPPPQTLVVFDDVLTTGSHFKAMQTVLKRVFPNAHIVGLFIARRRVPNPFEDEPLT